ncbi:MAG: tetratricopeptide repeat protein, partial [Pseudomonadota bacterium]
MSLINKMLQDLDARGSQPGHALQHNVKSVPDRRRALALREIGLVVLAVALVGAAGVMGWRYVKRPAAAPAPAAPVAQAVVKAPAAAVLVPPPPAPAPPAVVVPPVVKKPAMVARPVVVAGKAAPSHAGAPVAKKPVKEKTVPLAAPAVVAAAEGRQMNDTQRAETEYRRALASMQEGRVHEAIAGLERTVQVDPRHDAARQTLVGLLIEAHRSDEAISQLQVSLTLEPRQPAMAILLARLQIERGGSGIDTLTRTLPYANGNGEYHAFLAGALQRQQRNREAIEQYRAALRSA